MLSISRKLFNNWNDNNVRYCHWKSNEHLFEGLEGITDLDVLLDPADKSLAYKILHECDFLSCKSQFGSRYPNVEDWIGFDAETGRLIHLHLHYKMITGHKGMKEYTLPWSDEVLTTRVQDESTGVYISDPNYEIMTLYTRFGLKAHVKQIKRAKTAKFSIGEDNIKEINYLKQRVEWPKVEALIRKYYSSDADVFVNYVKKDKITGADFLRVKMITETNFRKDCRYSSIGVSIRSFYYFAASYYQWFAKKRGAVIITRKTPSKGKAPIITFMGQDGAGKSTVVKDIREWLSWKLEVSQFYLGSGDHYQPWEKKMANRLHRSNNHLAKLIRKWLPFSYLSKLGKNVYKTILKANRYANKGGFVLFDRYPQTQYVGINDGPKIRSSIMGQAKGVFLQTLANHYANKEEKYLQKAVEYTPDVVIKLMLTPEESIRRKPHENFDAVKQKHAIIESLVFENSKVYTVSAEQPYEEELIQIKNIIWENISK